MNRRDRLRRALLVLIMHGAGTRNGALRATCRYGIDLIDSGASHEFRALIRHRLRRALGLTRPPVGRRRRPWRAVTIDAKTDRLTPSGTIQSKPSLIFPSPEAPVLASIVIPCYNYGAFLEAAIGSARLQSLASTEIIVVDDGSTDELTRDVLQRLASDGGVRLILQENSGLPGARNRGIAAARGEYVCCLDADDLLTPTYLEQAIAVLETDRAAGFAYSWVRFFGDSSELWRTRDFDADTALIGNFTSAAAVFRRDDWQAIGGFSIEMVGGFEDWEFWIRLASVGRRGRTIAHPLFLHRRHGQTMTHTAKAMQPELRQRMRRLSPAFYESRTWRRRLGRLVGPVADITAPFAALSQPGVVADHVIGTAVTTARPGLIVIVAGLMNGGAHALLHDILRPLSLTWRIVILTTGAVEHPQEETFRALTQEIFHLDGFIESELWPAFLNYVIETRHASAILSSDSLWFLDHVAAVRRDHAHIRILDILHNHVPTATFRSAVGNSPAIDHHVVVSAAIAEALAAAGVPTARIAAVPNGVDAHRMFDPGRFDRGAARRALGIDPRTEGTSAANRTEPLLLVWVGRMSEEKRPLMFLDLVSAMASEHDVRGVMCGEGPLADEVDAAIKARGLSQLVERRPHAPREALVPVYAAADLLVLTSRVEGMPLVILEALATGCPVAATDVGDVRRIVRHQVNGYLVPVDGFEQLVGDVRAFGRDQTLQAAMRHQARASLLASEHHVARMGEAYARLLAPE